MAGACRQRSGVGTCSPPPTPQDMPTPGNGDRDDNRGGAMATAQHVDPDSSTRPLVETRKGRAGHSSLAREDDRQPEMTREPQSPAHRWASKVKRPAWGTPVRVLRLLMPSRRAPETVHNSPSTEIQLCTDPSSWVKPWHNPLRKSPIPYYRESTYPYRSAEATSFIRRRTPYRQLGFCNRSRTSENEKADGQLRLWGV